jgi:ribosomal protein S18 acetylase RimI-like enzyme
MLKPLTPAHAKPAWKFLSRHGLRDVFLASKVHEGALSFPDGAGQGRFLGAFDGAKLTGVLFLGAGGLIVFASEFPHVRRRFAEEAWREKTRVRLIVGEWDEVSDFWSHLSATGLTASRDWREVFMVADRKCVLDEPEPRLRLAVHEDVPVLVDLAARAYKEETGDDPLATMGEGYVRHVTQAVGEGRSYVIEDRGRLVFKADLSARCPLGAQIVGVFTEPDRRGQGFARRGVAEIVRRLTLPSPAGPGLPAVCLFVREDNAPARRAYERAGFAASMFYRRLFVDPLPVTRPVAASASRARR